MNPGHAWDFAGAVLDFLVSDALERSRGAIDFPAFSAAGSQFRVRIYGGKPGRFYGDEGVHLWLPRGLVAADNRMRHLKSLAGAGITDVHLLPVFDFGSVPERGCVTPTPVGTPSGESQQQSVSAASARDCFNWGYDPVHFTAPEGSYATDAADGAVRVVEFRRMVQALHRAGLRVGMAVVYNHTYASGQDSWSVLDRIVPGYYHRLDEAGRVTTSTCCPNTATEHRMMAKLMTDSAVTWAREYRIDR